MGRFASVTSTFASFIVVPRTSRLASTAGTWPLVVITPPRSCLLKLEEWADRFRRLAVVAAIQLVARLAKSQQVGLPKALRVILEAPPIS